MTHLTAPEVMEAAMSGIFRAVSSMFKGMHHRYGWRNGDMNTWEMAVEGACAERLVGKELGVYCTGCLGHGDDGADVGNIGVRSTRHLDGGLILHDTDHDNRPFVLVVGVVPEIHIAGWIYGREGKQKQYYKEPRPNRSCYLIPQSALRPIEELRELIKAGKVSLAEEGQNE